MFCKRKEGEVATLGNEAKTRLKGMGKEGGGKREGCASGNFSGSLDRSGDSSIGQTSVRATFQDGREE